MTRTPFFLILLAVLAACSPPIERAHKNASNPVQAACLNAQHPGASAPEFCQCLGKEAAYATQGDRKSLEKMAWMIEQEPHALRATLSDITPLAKNAYTRAKPLPSPLQKSKADWAVLSQNAQLRCSPHAAPENTLFFW